MCIDSSRRFSRFCFIAVVLAALGWWALTTIAEGSKLQRISREVQFQANPPGMAPGPSEGAPPCVLSAGAWDGYVWVRHAQAMADAGVWRLKITDFDNAPDGRGVHWNSGWAWWLIGLGWLDHRVTGISLGGGIARLGGMWGNPIAFVLLMGAFVAFIHRVWGRPAAVVAVLVAAASCAVQEGFSVGYPDHHGLHNLAIAFCVAGVLAGGVGFVGRARTAESAVGAPDETRARKCFLLSAIAGACGLWVSAITLSLCLLGIGIGAVLAFAYFRKHGSDLVSKPSLWRLWGWTGAAASFAFYLLEYFPSHVGMRLEVNHPLYSLAWAGGGELLCRLQRLSQRSGDRRRGRDLAGAAVAAAAILVLPVAIIVGRAAWYAPMDPFLFNLHKHIAEFHPVGWPKEPEQVLPLCLSFITPVWVALLSVLMMRNRMYPDWVRGAVIFVAAAGTAVTAAQFYQLRWGMAAGSVWLGGAPLVAMHWEGLKRQGRIYRGLLVALCLAPLMIFPVRAGMAACRDLLHPESYLERGNGFALLFRDIAQFIRRTEGPDARVVVLSSPNTSTPVAYFGRFHTIGTLYWENNDGLARAARMFNSTDDEALLRDLVAAGVTHVVFVNEENFLREYFDLQNPGAGDVGWRRTFGYRAFAAGNMPIWAKVLPYAAPDLLRKLNAEVCLIRVTPGQTLVQTLLGITDYQLVRKKYDGALDAARSAIKVAPEDPSVRIRLIEVLLAMGSVDAAKEAFNDALPRLGREQTVRVGLMVARAAAERRQHATAVDMLRIANKADPDNKMIINNLAWLLATSLEDSVRNGREAWVLSASLVEQTPDEPVFQGTLGAALAEVGDFEGAVLATRRALELAQASGRPQIARAAEQRLQMFLNERKWRE